MVDEAPGRMALRIALANVDGVQVEVIEDIGSSFDLYTEPLPEDGTFRIAFHHVCILIQGGIENWERHLAELGDRPHYYRPQIERRHARRSTPTNARSSAITSSTPGSDPRSRR